MSFIQILIISVGLAMDAFAVAICKGLKLNKIDYKYSSIIGIFFGVFQCMMAVLGWSIGIKFAKYVDVIDNLVSFVLLTAIGGKMICEAFEEKEVSSNKYDYKEIVMLSVATSVDALAVGVMLAMLDTNIYLASFSIGIVAFILSFAGVIIGSIYGAKYSKRAEISGGIILILLGVKMLIS